MTEYHGYLDRFTVLQNCVVVDGWANECDPAVFYDGKPLEAVWKSVDKLHLDAIFGEGARSWGFSLCAMLPTSEVAHDLFSFRFSAGKSLDSPCAHFEAPSDMGFHNMRDGFTDLVNSSGGRMLEIGSRDRSGSSYRGWFPGITEWVGIDVMDGPGVEVVGDAHCLSKHVTGQFDFAFSMAVFEHLFMPWKVAIEISKVLKPGGKAFIVSHAGWPLHEEPWDFWRFSREAWRALFNEHTGFKVVDAQYQYPARIIPDYIAGGDMARMSKGTTYLLSGCVVEKIGDAKVQWDGDAAEIYNMDYSYR